MRAIYREIISASIALDNPLSIAYLVPYASYTHAAAIKKFGSSLDYHAMATVRDIFTAVEKGEAEYAVIPIENSTEGSVREAFDSFVESELKIVAQIYLEISHALISNSPLEAIDEIIEHFRRKYEKPKWQGLSWQQRRDLFIARRGRCHWCQARLTRNNFTVEHIKPRFEGGTDDWDNLSIACEPCNTMRGGDQFDADGFLIEEANQTV